MAIINQYFMYVILGIILEICPFRQHCHDF